MPFSQGLILSVALTNSQIKYANTRTATPDEFNDLFEASTLTYDGGFTLSAGFDPGLTATASSGANYNNNTEVIDAFVVTILGTSSDSNCVLSHPALTAFMFIESPS